MTKRIIFIVVMLMLLTAGAQPISEKKDAYEYPKDPEVRQKLETWRDLKFGFMMHWGIYSQLGIVESWALCSEDQDFQDRGGMDYIEFKKMYFGRIKKFNPRKFDPAPWARAAKDAGMKYLVFTTKHHDGFCMFDTQQTDFKITGPDSPFRDHPRANISKEIFQAFRKLGFMIGTYFSKPDWRHPDYWSPLWATPNRNNNYDTRKYPGRWQRFRDFTFNQIQELMTGYSRVDILWLDGGWVRPHDTINDEVRSWGYDISKWEQDIDMPRIARMARKHQPGILIVDRTVHGPYENYRTPEQRVPDRALPYPWETCMTMTQNWGYVKQPKYKTAEKLVHTLIEVVSRGGNLLLNVGPTPDGTIEPEAYQRMAAIGRWMKINGSAIYATRQREQYREGDHIRFTRGKDGRTVYVFSLKWPGRELRIKSVEPQAGGKVFLLGHKSPLTWRREGEELVIQIPQVLQSPQNRPCRHAWVFRIRGAVPTGR